MRQSFSLCFCACDKVYAFSSRADREDVLQSKTHTIVCKNTASLFMHHALYNKKVGSCAYLNDIPAVFYLPGPSPAKYFFQQCSIFPGRHQPSIFDDEKLNFCVRDVYRWILFSIATGNGIITSFHLKLSFY